MSVINAKFDGAPLDAEAADAENRSACRAADDIGELQIRRRRDARIVSAHALKRRLKAARSTRRCLCAV